MLNLGGNKLGLRQVLAITNKPHVSSINRINEYFPAPLTHCWTEQHYETLINHLNNQQVQAGFITSGEPQKQIRVLLCHTRGQWVTVMYVQAGSPTAVKTQGKKKKICCRLCFMQGVSVFVLLSFLGFLVILCVCFFPGEICFWGSLWRSTVRL